MTEATSEKPHVRVTGITGGHADTVIAAGEIHGDVRVNDEVKRKLQAIFDASSTRVALREQMERTSVVQEIVTRLEAGHRWLVITGCPGEGKTTLGYMVLAAMIKKGWQVLSVDLPEKYHFVSSSKSPDDKIVYMLDDVLGAHVFDRSSLSTWQSLINSIHDNMSLILQYGSSATRESNESFLFIGRTNVFKSARSFFSKHEESVFGTCVIDLSDRFSAEERRLILEHHLVRKRIMVPEKEIDSVVTSQGLSPHGFAHCCEIYADLHPKLQEDQISIRTFFHKPLQFLDQTLKILFHLEDIKTLFEIMVKSNGQYNIDCEPDSGVRSLLKQAESKLRGVYVSTEAGATSFSHPSVYESVMLEFGREDPRFVIDHCSVSFLAERVKLGVGRESGYSCYIFIDHNNPLVRLLAVKFSRALEEGMFDIIASHSCRNESFCGKLLSAFVAKTSEKENSAKETARKLDTTDERGFTLLHAASRCGNTTAVRVIVRLGADLNLRCGGQTDHTGKTSLHLLAENTPDKLNIALTDLLVSHGVDVNATDPSGRTVLHQLYVGDGIETPHKLLAHMMKHGADRYKQDKYGHLALPWTYSVDHVHSGTKTRKSLPTAQKPTNMQYTDLMWAVLVGDLTSVADLVKQGADVRDTDRFGRTALHYLCLCPSISLEILSLLLPTDVNIRDQYGSTPLHLLCRREDVENVKEWKKVFEILLSNGGDMNVLDEFGFSCLLHLRGILDIQLVNLLVSHCPDLEVDNGDGMSILHYCTIEGLDQCLEVLLRNGARLNKGVSRDVNDNTHYVIVKGMTPLQLACRSDKTNTRIIKLLLDNQAAINDAGRTGSTALYYVNQGFLKFTWLRPRKVWNLAESRSAVNKKRIAICNLLIERGADLYKQNTKGTTALHGDLVPRLNIPLNNLKSEVDKLIPEVMSQSTESARETLNRYKRQTDPFGRTALHLLCLTDNIDSRVLSLFSTTIDVNSTDKFSNTALHYLCRRNDIMKIANRNQLLNILLQNGADINAYDEFGLSSMCYLREVLDDELVDVLVSNSCNICVDSGDGISLLHYVCLHGYQTHIEKLISTVSDVDQRVSRDVKSESGSSVISSGETALHLCCRTDRCNLDIVQLLLDRGSSVNLTTKDDVTPLHFICDRPYRFAAYTSRSFLDWDCARMHSGEDTDKVRFSVCRLLVEKGAERDRKDKDGRTALHGDYKRRYEQEEKQMLSLLT